MTFLNRLAQGGQTYAHSVRMLRQVIKIGLMTSLTIGILALVTRLLWTDFELMLAGWYYVKARICALLGLELSVNATTWLHATGRNLSTGQVTIPTEYALKVTTPLFRLLLEALKTSATIAGIVAAISGGLVLSFFALRGNLAQRRRHVEGRQFASAGRFALTLKFKRQASSLRLHNLPLIKGAETQHMIITGGTGSGKTNCLHHLLPQIRERGDKLILLDPTGTLADAYYTPNDVLLNPLDERSMPWHPWAECQNRFDYDSMAESIIPQNHHERDMYWSTAARTLLSTALEKCAESAEISELCHWLLHQPLPELCNHLIGTKAASFMDVSSEKTAASIRSLAATYLSSLEYLSDTDQSFSIRDWVAQPDSSWLFLNCSPPQRATMTSLLTCWFSVATRSLMHLPPDRDRRVWFVVDELPSLNRVKDLELFLTESRKYGGCAVLALQSPAQLETIYGRSNAQTIASNCSTKVVFVERDPEISERISRAFGKREIEEYREGISYGSHQMRDGVTLSKMSSQKPVVTPTAIQSLKPNEAYVSLPGDYPVTRVVLPIKGRAHKGGDIYNKKKYI